MDKNEQNTNYSSGAAIHDAVKGAIFGSFMGACTGLSAGPKEMAKLAQPTVRVEELGIRANLHERCGIAFKAAVFGSIVCGAGAYVLAKIFNVDQQISR
jgi:hypothetical protein